MSRGVHAAMLAILSLACLGGLQLWVHYGAFVWMAGFAGWCG